jgi:hypothetical protein
MKSANNSVVLYGKCLPQVFLSLICLVAGTAVLAVAQEKAKLPVPQEPAGMIKMFNGKDLTGWDGDPRLWSVKDGAIHGETTAENPAKGNTFLIWKNGIVKDFELRLSFRCNAANNSGVQYRSKPKPFKDTDVNKWGVAGYQIEVRNEVVLPNVAGFIYDEGGKRGRICLVGEKATWENGKKTVLAALCNQDDYKASFKLDGWNDFVIIAKGNNIKHYLNGLLIVDFTDQPDLALNEGIVALQLHAGKPMWCEFKDIRVKQY